VTAAMQIYDFLCHNVFLYSYPLSIQLSYCHIWNHCFKKNWTKMKLIYRKMC